MSPVAVSVVVSFVVPLFARSGFGMDAMGLVGAMLIRIFVRGVLAGVRRVMVVVGVVVIMIVVVIVIRVVMIGTG